MFEITRPTDTVRMMTGVTTNTTSDTIRGRIGYKTFWAEVVGTGAVTATVTFYGCRTQSATYGVQVAQIVLSDTDRDQDAASVSAAAYPYYYAVTTNVTGTGATVLAEVFY